MKVFVLTFCPTPEVLYGATLFMDSFRTGFPNAELVVVDNGSDESVVPALERNVRALGGTFQPLDVRVQHHDFLEWVIANHSGRAAIIDPDVVFWDSCEDFQVDGLLAGRLIPTFHDDSTGCLTRERLHTSFWLIPDLAALRERMVSTMSRYWEYHPLRPLMLPSDDVPGQWLRWDTGATLMQLLGEQAAAFTPEQLDCYDHLFYGSHLNKLTNELRKDLAPWHDLAKQDWRYLKGAWREQQAWFEERSPL